jgi:hypothetical protein
MLRGFRGFRGSRVSGVVRVQGGVCRTGAGVLDPDNS